MLRIIFSLLFIAAAAGIFFRWDLAGWREIQGLKNQEKSLEANLSETEKFKQTKDDLISKYNSITEESISRLSAFLPDESESLELLLSLEKTTLQNGLNLKKTTLGEIKKPESETQKKKAEKRMLIPSVEPLVFEWVVEGHYLSFQNFLKMMEKSLRLINVSEISFSAGGSGKGEESYEFLIKAESYFK